MKSTFHRLFLAVILVAATLRPSIGSGQTLPPPGCAVGVLPHGAESPLSSGTSWLDLGSKRVSALCEPPVVLSIANSLEMNTCSGRLSFLSL